MNPHAPDPGPDAALRALRARAHLPSPLTQVDDERFARHGVRLLLTREDLIHPEIPGNKWRKLLPNLRAAVEGGHHRLLTFGGAYSNHLRATAAAGRLLGLETIGVVRGEELAEKPLNPSLARCAADGMRLHFVSRAAYRRRGESAWVTGLHQRFGWPIRWVRGGIEVSVLVLGWLLGGTIGLGTVIHALLIGPLVHLSLRRWDKAGVVMRGDPGRAVP